MSSTTEQKKPAFDGSLSGRAQKEVLHARRSAEMAKLSDDDLAAVAGGTSDETCYSEAICEHCGAKGPHRMDSGWTAICRKCGKKINLKAQ